MYKKNDNDLRSVTVDANEGSERRALHKRVKSSIKSSTFYTKVKDNRSDVTNSIIILTLGFFLWNLEAPSGLNIKAWHLLDIFMCTIAGVILKPFPMPAVSLIAMTIAVITKTLDIKTALSGFSSPVVWLVFCAFIISGAFIRTGLGARIAYNFVAKFGKNIYGISYALVLTELLLAPFIPSNTARGGGVIYPIAKALSLGYNSIADDRSRKKVGAYLIQLCFQANVITSAMFVTALAGNALIVSLASDAGVSIDMISWAKAAVVPGLCALIIMPMVLRKIYPPKLIHTPESPKQAIEKLESMGPLSFDEKVMIQTFAILLTLWVFGGYIGIDPTSATLLGVVILMLSGTLNMSQILNEKGAWETFIWLGIFLMLATSLKDLGMMDWFSSQLQSATKGHSWVVTVGILSTMYYLVHYLYASVTAHISSMFAAFLMVSIAAGAPPFAAAMIFAILSSLSGGLTHYGTGSAPIYFSSNYVKINEWWSIGAIIGLLNIIIFITVGYFWWSLLGII